jgi:insulysin
MLICNRRLVQCGTTKYPKEETYTEYLAEHSGKHNSYTLATTTTFSFELTANAKDGGLSPMPGALDIFTQFFIEPSFSSSIIDRELKAVDLEVKTDRCDSNGIEQLFRSLSNPNRGRHGMPLT